MNRSVCTLPFTYDDTPERRVLNLEGDGLPCVPVLGYSRYKQSRPSVSEHLHPGCMEITLCLRGSLVFDCEGQSYRLLPGNLFVTQPDEWHRLSTNPRGLMIYFMFLRVQDKSTPLFQLPHDESDALRVSLTNFPRRLISGNIHIRRDFQRAFKLYDYLPPGVERTLALRITLLHLLLNLLDASHSRFVKPEFSRVENLIQIIQSHPEKEYPVDFMMRKTALSESRLNTCFKQLTGLPPYSYLLTCRLRKAQTLLEQETSSITEISHYLNFSSSQHFAMQFKREFGCSPSTWRKNR